MFVPSYWVLFLFICLFFDTILVAKIGAFFILAVMHLFETLIFLFDSFIQFSFYKKQGNKKTK